MTSTLRRFAYERYANNNKVWQIPDHAKALYFAACLTSSLDGDVVELGVYKGGSARLLRDALPGKPIHLFDTFAGLPNTSTIDKHLSGQFADTSVEEVKKLFVGEEDVFIYKGLFPDTLSGLKADKFCFAHFDGDLYESARSFIAHFWPRLVKGGVMAFHDYDFPHTPGVKLAVDNANLPLIILGPQQAFAVKP